MVKDRLESWGFKQVWPGVAFGATAEGRCSRQVIIASPGPSVVKLSKAGSVTAGLFCVLLWSAWLQHIPAADLFVKKVLILDSGGGSLLLEDP